MDRYPPHLSQPAFRPIAVLVLAAALFLGLVMSMADLDRGSAGGIGRPVSAPHGLDQ
jgi:hypothetical protein